MLRVALLLARAIRPISAAYIAAWAVGAPWIAPDLVRICKRESPGHACARAVGVHRRDAWVSDREWRSQVRLGHLDPVCQRDQPGEWGPRGNWGLSAASHWQFLPVCYQPQWLDVPLVSAIVAARKYLKRCAVVFRASRWCPKGVVFAFEAPEVTW